MRRALALALIALVPMLPALVPGALAYMDNGAHLVTVRDLQDILPEEGWFSGWHTRANAGMAQNQVNAPLVWAAVAALGGLFGVVPVYLAGMLASNMVFAWGAHRLYRRFLDADAAWFGAALAAIAAPDLYGFGGAVGGMWPHRLANGILLAGLGSTAPASPGKLGAWLALVLVCHTYSGMDAAAIVGIAILLDLGARRWREAGRRIAGALVGAALSAPFWVPLLDAELRPELAGEIRFLNMVDHLALLLTPLELLRINDPLRYEFLGGPLNFGWSVLVLAGIGAAWRHREVLRERLRPLAAPPLLAGPAFLAVLVVIVCFVVPPTLTDAFGPNPWRHLTLVRAAICGLAGAGLVALGYGARSSVGVLVGALAVAGAWGGAREIHAPLDAETRALHEALGATWRDLEAAAPKGRIYHQNTSLTSAGPEALFLSHVGASLAFHTDLPVVGTWYSISPVASEPHMRSSRAGLFGTSKDRWFSQPLAFWARARAFDVGGFVTVEPELADFLDTQVGVERVATHAPFAAFVYRLGGLGTIECPDGWTCTTTGEGRGWVEARVTGTSAPSRLGVRQTWHPWWTATLDGEPLAPTKERGTGRLVFDLPAFEGEKELKIRWVDPTRWTAWIALAGLVAAAVTWRMSRDPREARAAR